MKSTLLILSLLLSLPALATVTVGAPDCPIQFEGSVKQIIKEEGPARALALQKVIFENHHTIKGEVKNKVLLDILQNGPFQIEEGENYRVQLRGSKLCWIEQL